MSRKYIKEIISQNFIYPNNKVSEYDIEMVHDINNNCPTGTVNSFSATTVSSSSINISYNITWNLNGAEPFISNAAIPLKYFSIHMMPEGQDYFKPWRTVAISGGSILTTTGATVSSTFGVVPSQFGLASFSNGTYYFEVRFLGKRCVSVAEVTLDLSAATPTPTPTSTITPTPTPSSTLGLTPTPTPTPSITPSGGDTGTSLTIFARDVAGTRQTISLFYNVNGGGNVNVPGATGTQLPSSCTQIYTITGLTTSDNVTFGTSNSCVMNGQSGTSCPTSSGSAVTYSQVMSLGTNSCAITVDTETIP